MTIPARAPKSARRPAGSVRWASWLFVPWLILGTVLVSIQGWPDGPVPAARAVLYDLHLSARRALLLASVKEMSTAETRRFVVHYEAADASWVPVILECADGSWEAVARRLGWTPLTAEGERVHIIIYPDPTPLERQFGPEAGFRALGAYWCGVIQLLSPRVWLSPEPSTGSARAFWAEGPFVHEYTHYVLDRLIPYGNYPRWLSEGLAQYVEHKETGYVWLDETNTIRPPVREAGLYRLIDLQRSFDRLPNTALAYRQAFLLVAYLEDTVGWSGINGLLRRLARLERFEAALQAVTGLTLSELEENWLEWLDLSLGWESGGRPTGKEGPAN